MSDKRSVLIIRPLSAAQRTAALVAARGFVPYIMPLSAFVPLAPVFTDKSYDGVIATSAAAFLQPLPAEAAWLEKLPLYCVGSRTAEAACNSGFSQVAVVAGTGEELADVMGKHKGRHFIYLAGQMRWPVLECRLSQAGVRVDSVEVYATRIVPPTAEQLAGLPHPVDFILLYSAGSMRFLSALAGVAGKETKVLCLSARIAAAMPAAFTDKMLVAAEPKEQALLSLLSF